MYSYYLHGIEELHKDSINRERIANFDRCSDQIKDHDTKELKRTTRISLTIRFVEKTTKFQFGSLKK